MSRLQKAFNKLSRWVFDKKKTSITPDDLDSKPAKALTQEINNVLRDAVQEGIKYEIPKTLLDHIHQNVYVFSGAKTYAELRQISDMLLDDKGELKSFSKFYKEVRGVHDTYNKNYLESEYLFAQQSAQMASKWADFDADGDAYNLQYRTANDDKVRYTHQLLHDTTLPPSDPFWDNYFPPNGWRCRCNVVQVRKSKYPESDSAQASQLGAQATTTIGKGGVNTSEMFRFNPGKEKTIFPATHPYFGDKKVVDKLKENLIKKDDETTLKLLGRTAEDVRNESFWNTAKEFKLTEAEALSIDQYTGNYHALINPALRKNNLSDDQLSYVNTLNRALDKMPLWKSKVYRGTHLQQEHIELLKDAFSQKTPYKDDGYVSSSVAHGVANSFKENAMFIINSKSGRKIEKMSILNKVEKEVLFKPATRFKVLDLIQKGKNIIVYLDEI